MVCTGGYYAEAKRVARASGRHATVVDICMFHSDEVDQGTATPASTSAAEFNSTSTSAPAAWGVSGGEPGSGGREALRYIKSLPRIERALLLQQHGNALISKFKLEMEVGCFWATFRFGPALDCCEHTLL